ncbi:unnamed protein product [Meloidogyne enterolobii]|uniref:Uncharacterized protein n=1 Tax=Meloidogyne enterolobii TaxID=390850 RepID=A0ACB0YSZ8_MELEN
MLSLPLEVQLRILKYLNFNELISVKQTNSYFCNLINKYEGKLARRKFYELSLWQASIAKSTRLFLHSGKKLFVCMSKTDDEDAIYYILKLPNQPKNLKQMIIIRYWLERLFECDFESCNFGTFVFNPEMIKILFDNDKTISLQFNIKYIFLRAGKKRIENIFKFYLNHLSNSEYLSIVLCNDDITDHHINILFHIIINKGNKKSLKIFADG